MSAKLTIKHNETTILDMEPDQEVVFNTTSKFSYDNLYLSLEGVDFWKEEFTLTPLCFKANQDNCTISMMAVGTPVGQNFSYSTDCITWTTFTPGTTTVTLNSRRDKVYFRGNNSTGINKNLTNYCYFVITGSVSASGDIMSLIDNGACTTSVIPNDYCFAGMFKDCDTLTTPPSLRATTLTVGCYEQIFYGCSTLAIAPVLPSTELSTSCYAEMFYGCEALKVAPTLQATALEKSCYENMFAYCTSLTTPPALPASILATYCYTNMFYGCSSLIVAVKSDDEYCQRWAIPTGSKCKTDYALVMENMFYGCEGVRDSNSPAFNNNRLIYYTQNVPV